MSDCLTNQPIFDLYLVQLNIEFPENLPVSARRHEIEAALHEHQVIIVCGETGSGKTTQLPKIALAMGRGKMNAAPGQQGKLIGHTQPRRIAASSVAKRIAQELNTPLGECVGYRVRFQDRLSKTASVKLMTDGILLAETQSDPMLNAYDTLIIDEAHERSLNIDFLLGYLKQLLPRRPDLKLVVTSATIDADRFARHFETAKGPAPIIMVSGRTFPVEQRYRPFEESRDYDLNHAIADAVDELWQAGGGGDILVFLPGEREIREAADHLRRHLSHQPLHRHSEVLPLFARLSQAEQDRVFDSSSGRRIVLATNVAETSLTVPGIRYVIDTGTARVKRYSIRSKVEQLLVEPISQAAANQRSGRCGRVANGICIRLYDEKDYSGRPRFTDPEILRSSLAAVILRMKSLHLGQVEQFPFLDAPSGRSIADGYQLLLELGAVDERNQLTSLGKDLASLPLDPRVGRMLLEARKRGSLEEVLIIASALSVQDVRDRPIEMQAQADQQHAQFDDDKSEFSGYLRLWKWIHDARGGHDNEHKLSVRQYEQLLRQHFINVRRVREWRDTHTQLLTVVTEHRWKLNTTPAGYEPLHKSLLAGLLGNIGCKLDDEEVYLGARGIKFYKHPGAHLRKKPGRWIMAAELVETTRLFGRGLAAIEPAWLEEIGAHLLKKQMLEPHWEKKYAEAVAFERATLYGLVVYNQRRKSLGQIDPTGAREVFLRQGLVAGLWETRLQFLAANLKLIAQIEELEHKSRRQDVLVDDELIYAFYEKKIPAEIYNGRQLEDWWKQASDQQRQTLLLSRQDLMRHQAGGVTSQAFPRQLRLGGIDCAVQYLHQPGDSRDGITVTVPLFVLNQVNEERCEWLVPGMLKEKIQALLKSLPQRPRSRYVPLPESAQRLADDFNQPEIFGNGSLLETLLKRVRDETSLDVKPADFKLDMLAPHLFMNLCVVNEHGRQLAMGRNLSSLKAQWGHQARGAFQALAPLRQAKAAVAQQAYQSWSFGELPELMEISKAGQSLIGYPALIDQGDSVMIEVFDEPEVARERHRSGLQKLFALQVRDALKYLEKNLPDLQKSAVAFMPLGSLEDLKHQMISLALDRAFLQEPLPTQDAEFSQRLEQGKSRLTLIANEVARMASVILQDYSVALRKIKEAKVLPEISADCQRQLQQLMHKQFLLQTPWAQLQHFSRYLKAMVMRLDKARTDAARDLQKMAEIRPQESRYWRLVAERKGVTDERMNEFRWMLEELRVSFFAQELRTPQPVSIKRLDKIWAQLNH